jgi:hypothetical protein
MLRVDLESLGEPGLSVLKDHWKAQGIFKDERQNQGLPFSSGTNL